MLSRKSKPSRKMPVNYAHRGASAYCPENTIQAFFEAVRLGANGLETDVQLTRDGVPVLIHDETLDRTTNGKGRVKETDLAQLRRLDAGGWFHESFRGARIPTLEELLSWLRPRPVMLNLELKNSLVTYRGLEEAVIREVRRHRMEDRVILSSFDPFSMLKCKRLAPEIRTGYLMSTRSDWPWEEAKHTKTDGVHPARYLATRTFIQGARRRGLNVVPWTVNDPEEIRRLAQLGVDGIISNTPDRVQTILNALFTTPRSV